LKWLNFDRKYLLNNYLIASMLEKILKIQRSCKICRYAVINLSTTYSRRGYSPLGARRKERQRERERESAIIVHRIVFLALDTRFKTQSAALVRNCAERNHDQIYRSPGRSYQRGSAQKPLYADNQYCHLTVHGARTHFPFS